MLLAADVVNTNVKLGIFDGDNLKFKLRFSTDENKTSDELAVELFTFLQIYNIDAKSIDGAIISSVVPKFTYNLRSAKIFPGPGVNELTSIYPNIVIKIGKVKVIASLQTQVIFSTA